MPQCNTLRSIMQPGDARQCDILILGTGIAGLYTALKCAALGLGRVVILTKKKLEDSSTEFAQGGIAAAIAPGDSPTLHLEDTLMAGDGLCDPVAARALVEDGPDCVRELASWGVRFDMVGEDFELTREGAHSRRRILHARGDATGDEIRRGLEARVRNTPEIEVHEDEFARDLILDEGVTPGVAGEGLAGGGAVCRGVVSIGPTGEEAWYLAKAVVIATGGAGQLYRHSTNPDVATGDGIAMAWRAGAELMDMEFIQFHPTALYSGESHPGDGRPRVLISEAIRGEGAILLNIRGERFMPRYHPLAELAPRDVVARAIAREMEATGTPYVFLDTRPIGPAFPSRFPTIYERCREHGIDPVREPIPVSPAAHYTMGGIRTGLDGSTNIPGLYACGEAACTGVHGANRLASNSLLEGVVFGRRIAHALFALWNGMGRPTPSAGTRSHRAGSAGAPQSASLATASPSPAAAGAPHPTAATAGYPSQAAAAPGQLSPEEVRSLWHRVQDIMWTHVGLYREEARLRKAYGEMTAILRRLSPCAGSTDRATLELLNLATVATAVVRAALERRESRGAHFRSDHPARDDANWLKHIVICGQDLYYVKLRT